jgi:peptidoglycan/LPS O-acetylase OafA/YrhL
LSRSASITERQTSLDGLRGIAVTMVFFYHHDRFQAGWTGVDLFFVISGYLITTILRRTRGDEHFWKEFWIKRATRILPPLVVLLVAVAIMDHEKMLWIRPFFGPTRALWSLAVEEHFYLLWPIAVRRLQRRTLMAILLGILVAEPLLRAFAISRVPDWQFIYFLTPFRLDGICLGSLLALLAEEPEVMERLGRWSPGGLVLTVGVYVALRWRLGDAFTRGEAPFYNAAIYTLVALVAFFLIAYLVRRPGSWAARVFSFGPLVFMGSISYGLYLYQSFVIGMLWRLGLVNLRMNMLWSGVITVLLAWVSFRFYEKPLILWGKRKAQSLRPASLRSEPVSTPTTP